MSSPSSDETPSAVGVGDLLQFVATEGPVIGSLCTGLLGLDLGVAAVLGGRIAWFSEVDPHAERILTRRLPGVPNLGDLRAVDFSGVERVDVLTAGFPCQDISAAGRRAGIEKGQRSGLWFSVLDAVRVLRPSLLVLENVAALRWRNGGLDRVLGGLAEARYDAVWRCVRASDVGAAHRRERVFVCAVPQPDDADPAGPRRRAPRSGRSGAAPRGRTPGQPQRRGARGDEVAADTARVGHRNSGPSRRARVPSPAVAASSALGDAGGGGRGEFGGVSSARVRGGRRRTSTADADCGGRQELHTPHPRRRGVASRPGSRAHLTGPERNMLRRNANSGGGGGGFVAVFPLARGALLPTPTAHDGSSNGISAVSRQGGLSLLDSLRLLPTPRPPTARKAAPGNGARMGTLMLRRASPPPPNDRPHARGRR
ncbi:DNA cytosine methyltransferase [Amycolatopsis sp. NPDC051758]|uniref:DNA cytosine methyltransferase n=1 Tax=Amycolatopsis sp. NPDC051758 TaxID=3363935 RepID=UPI0037BDDF96